MVESEAAIVAETVPLPGTVAGLPRIVVGVTSAQTCLVLRGRPRALRMAGFDVTLTCSPDELLTQTAEAEGVTAQPVRMKRGIAPVSDLRALCSLLMLLWRLEPQITDFSTPKAGLLGNLAAWAVGVPHRVYTLRGLKMESTEGWKRTLLLWMERLAAGCAHVVLCNSYSLRSKAIVLGIAPAKKLQVLGNGSSNGVDVHRFCPGESCVRCDLGIADGGPVLGFVGRLTKDKGIPELLVAFDQILSNIPGCWLLLVGWFDHAEDELDGHWRRHVAQHSRIRHTGFVADTAPYYRAMDVLILPTHREGFPNVVLEAAATGVPAITTECTGSRDAVLPEVTGLLIPPGRPYAITEAALKLLRDDEKRLRLGKAARKLVVDRYSQERVLEMATEFYQGLL